MELSRGKLLVSLALERQNKKTDINNNSNDDVSEIYIATPLTTNDIEEQSALLSEEAVEQELDEFYDLDDSIADPDFIPESDSGSENEDTNTREMTVDHEEVVSNVRNENTKTKSGESNWIKNQNKRLRMQGKAYKGMKKEDGKWGFVIDRNKRTLGERNCSKRCATSKVKQCSSFNEDDRKAIFKMFWENMNWEERKVYVNSLVGTSATASKTAENSRRNLSYQYYLRKDSDRKLVCKGFFLSTLGIKEKSVYGWVETASHGIPVKVPEEGKYFSFFALNFYVLLCLL